MQKRLREIKTTGSVFDIGQNGVQRKAPLLEPLEVAQARKMHGRTNVNSIGIDGESGNAVIERKDGKRVYRDRETGEEYEFDDGAD